MRSKIQLLKSATDWDLSDPETAAAYYRLEAVEMRAEMVEVLGVEVDMGDGQASYYNLRIVSTGQVVESIAAVHIVDSQQLEGFYESYMEEA